MGGLLVFDGDCGFCTSCAKLAERWFSGAFETAPYQFVDLGSLGLTRERAAAAVQWVASPTDEPLEGAAAVAAALVEGGGFRSGPIGRLSRFIGRGMQIRPLTGLCESAYRFVARNRHRLPGATPACRLDDLGSK